MRRLALVCTFLFVTTICHAQVIALPPSVATPIPLTPPVYSTYSNAVFDQKGNLLVFESSYTYTQVIGLVPTIKTHVTVITGDGKTKKGFDFDGSFQILGVGRQAVYAIENSYAPIAMTLPVPPTITGGGTGVVVATANAGAVANLIPVRFSVKRRLVALNVVAGTLPATLPGVDLLGYGGDVKISAAGNDGAPDNLAIIDAPVPVPLAPPTGSGTTTAPRSLSRSVTLYTFDGSTFTKIDTIAVP
jgi:hypothetical protein